MKNKNILIVKIGALGDVVRTTPILRVLRGNRIYWLTNQRAIPLLPSKRYFIKKIFSVEEINKLKNIKFDLVINLEEDLEIAKFITEELIYKKIIGVFYSEKENRLRYTKESKKWYDMSLISELGLKKANKLKWENKLSYQEILFSMVGKKFKGEEYVINYKVRNNFKNKPKIIAIEKNVGEKWPMKRWPFYHFLKPKLEKMGYKVFYLRYHRDIIDYVREIDKCDILICGDTLAMHLGLALKKKILAIFICTSPSEIYNYGTMVKVVSPKLKQAFYKKSYDRKLTSAIKVKDVLNKFYELLKL